MNSTNDSLTLKCLRGSPIFVDDVCAVYPPKLGEIADLGYEKFLTYLNAITMERPEVNKKENPELAEALENLSDFQYMIWLTQVDAQMNSILKGAFRFFLHENVFFSLQPAEITVGTLEEKHILDEEGFYSLRRYIKKVCWLDRDSGDEIIIYADDDPRTKALKQQMIVNRKRVARAKAKQQGGGDTELEFSDLVASVAAGNCGLNIDNIWNITYYAFHDQMKRMGWREQFDINQRAAMAGAKIKKEDLKHWIKSITTKDK